MLTKKLALVAASAMLVTSVAFAVNTRPAYAAKVDCDAVMGEVNSGKHAKEIATDLKISTSSVYRCKRQAKAAAKAGTKTSLQAKSGKDMPAMSAPSSAMGAPSPAMAAPAAAASPK
ncbi:MAG TPA: hypothetical protein VE243_06850 [Candidatus Acidoferrum sp.]|nr:hypothetical protein [Candidatus Acidoferrum sp.]